MESPRAKCIGEGNNLLGKRIILNESEEIILKTIEITMLSFRNQRHFVHAWFDKGGYTKGGSQSCVSMPTSKSRHLPGKRSRLDAFRIGEAFRCLLHNCTLQGGGLECVGFISTKREGRTSQDYARNNGVASITSLSKLSPSMSLGWVPPPPSAELLQSIPLLKVIGSSGSTVGGDALRYACQLELQPL